jgi:hypothetical protein
MYDIRTKGEDRDRLSAEQIRSWIHGRFIDGDTLARLHGEQEWKPLSSFSEFEADLSLQKPPLIPPTPQTKAEKLAQSSFTLGILSIFCGLTALPAIIQSIRALVRIRKDGSSKAARRKAIFSLIFSSCILAFIIFSGVSAYTAAQSVADQINCVNNMKQLALAIKIYEGDHNNTFPPNQWCDVLLANKAAMSDFNTNLTLIFHCPAAPKNQRCSYAMNSNLVGIKDTTKIAEDTVLLFESDAGWNAVGGPEITMARHHSRLNVALVDGSVQYIELKDIGKLRWNPYTNAPTASGK